MGDDRRRAAASSARVARQATGDGVHRGGARAGCSRHSFQAFFFPNFSLTWQAPGGRQEVMVVLVR